MSYTPEQLRECAFIIGENSTVSGLHIAGLFRAHADALEENARLKAHAKAMADRIENDNGKSTAIFYKRLCDAAAAYRIDFPKEGA